MSVYREFGAPLIPDRVPLTATQKARLLVDCVPLVFFTVAVGLYLTVLKDIVGEPSPLFFLLMGLVFLAVGHRAFQRVRDLASGIALVQDDVLRRLRRSMYSGGSNRPRYGEFEKLGKLRMMAKPFHEGQIGARYRVYYSPASKIVWSMDLLG
jgi:hypothetical protein